MIGFAHATQIATWHLDYPINIHQFGGFDVDNVATECNWGLENQVTTTVEAQAKPSWRLMHAPPIGASHANGRPHE